MDVVFLAFANEEERPLMALKNEDDAIMGSLAPRQAAQHFMIHRDSAATIDKIANYLSLYRDNIVLFHYAGHADGKSLHLGSEAARSQGVAELLAQCPRLKLVVLNGCSTKGQIKYLRECGVKAVIATHAPIDDNKAETFAQRFYQCLANNDDVNTAFDTAIAQVRSGADQSVFRSSSWDGEEESDFDPNEPMWALIADDEVLQWRLPDMPSIVQVANFEPNVKLLEKLVETLADYNDEIQGLQNIVDMGGEVDILTQREAILKALPYPLSEHVRKLLVANTQGGAGQFFDKLGADRLEQMHHVYITLIELLSFIMLSQLWDALSKGDIPDFFEEERQSVREFMYADQEARRKFDHIKLIRHIREAFERNDVKPFLEELPQLSQALAKSSKFSSAIVFFQSLGNRLHTAKPNDQDATPLCIMGEEHLATLLGQSGFLVRYTFASVKGIDLVKYRHIKKPMYRHRIVHMVQRFVGLAETIKDQMEYMDTVSVLLLKTTSSGNEFLNLTPFVIDQNAFDDKASIAKLHFFDQYRKDRDAYIYRHIYKPKDMPLIIQEEKAYKVLKLQFDAFAKLLFNHKMQQAG